MLPFVFDAEDKKDSNGDEEGYDPNNHQKEIEDYYKQYEEQQTSSRFYRDRVGLTTPQEIEMQRRLIHAQQAIAKINQQKQKLGEQNLQQSQYQQQCQQQQQQQQQVQPPQSQYSQSQNQGGPSEDNSRGFRKMSKSPDWARRSRSRTRSRSRERDADYRKKDRDMRRRSSRSGSRSPSKKDRGDRRDRDRDREHHRRRRDHRSRSRSRSPTNASSSRNYNSSRRRRSRSASRDRGNRQHEWNPGTPSYKLALTSIPNDVDNAKITFAFSKTGFLPKDVRTMTKFDKLAKQVRTFAFVEFSDQSVAERWMADNEGYLYLDDGRRVVAEYAKGDPYVGQAQRGDDWICANCSMNNFVKRMNCFKCDMAKEQSQELEKLGVHMVGVSPCDTLLIRGLPDGCVNSSIFDSLAKLVCLNSISMIKLSESKRFCYLQMKSADEATMLLNLTYKSPLKVKEKDVQVSYCKDSMTKLIQQQMQILTQNVPSAQGGAPGPNGGPQGNMTGAEIAANAMAKANAVKQASHQVGQMMAIPGHPMPHQQPPMMPPNASVPTPNFNVPPPTMAMPPNYMPQPMQHPNMMIPNPQQNGMPPPVVPIVTQPQLPPPPQHKNGIIGITPTPRGVFARYLPPNPMAFMPDANSGYYLDPVTNFFYDSNTGYYYNNEAKHWCTWDATYHTYFAVEDKNNAAATSAASAAAPTATAPVSAIPTPSSASSAPAPAPEAVDMQVVEDSDEEESDVVEKKDKKKKKKKDKDRYEEKEKKNPIDVAKQMLKWQKQQEKDKKKVQMSLKLVNPMKPIEMKNVFQTDKRKTSAGAMMVQGSSSVLMNDDDDEEEEQMMVGIVNPHTGKIRNDPARLRQTSEAAAEEYNEVQTQQNRRGPSAIELREAMERALVDESKKMCLLCKRAFPSVDVLKKHVDKSELHKTNLQQKRLEWSKQYADVLDDEEEKQEEPEMPKIVYRDRAKERRKQYGMDSTGYAFDNMGGSRNALSGSRHEDAIRRESEEAAKKPLDDRNIGSRLLKSMGWKEGQGVGKNGQGIVNPIEAERFVQGAGLGSSGSKLRGGVEASHKEKTRQALFSRYHDA